MTAEIRSATLTRRHFTLGAAGAVLLALPASRALASATPTTDDFASLGYPELSLTVTDAGYEGLPASTAAGRYLIKLTSTTTKGPGTAAFVSPTPAGVSAADFIQLAVAPAGPPPGASPVAGATPDAGSSANQAPPLVVYQMHFAGGAVAQPGGADEAVIDLGPGEWVIWGDDPTAAQKPVILKVTGEAPKDAKDPSSDITATLIDFAITMDGALTAGKHTLKIQHQGAQPHFLFISKGPDTMTKEQVMTALMTPAGTPIPGGLRDTDLTPVFASATQSIGTFTWHPIELTAGTYFAACFFPTAGTGVPHALNGMIDVFKVSK